MCREIYKQFGIIIRIWCTGKRKEKEKKKKDFPESQFCLVVAACDTIREALEFGGKEDTIGKVC